MKNYSKIVAFGLLLICLNSTAQTIHDINEKLGRGINYGNMLEAPSEEEWGNPWQPEYPEIISSLGFNHVRIPVRWEPAERSSDVPPYTINPGFMDRIKEIVDATLENQLLAIVNMHHHESLYDDPDGQKDRFLAQWQQIAEEFKDYPDSVVFEIMNEPHGNLTPEKWNEFLQEALDVIRIENPTRAVLIGTPEYGGLDGLSKLVLPEDDWIILTIHYYNPFQFTHQGAEWVGEEADDWLGTEWLDSDIERAVVESEFAPVVSLSQEKNIPIHIGEFGAYSTADIISRSKWTTYLGRYFEQMGWSWAYWEFSAGFGIYDPLTATYQQDLIDALLINEMPDPVTYKRTKIYESDFSTNLDGWFLNVNSSSGAAAQLSREGGAIKTTISQLGTENWHIQLMRNNFSLEADKKYAFTFTGTATDSRPVGFYMGKSSDPWTQYGTIGVSVGTTEATFTGALDMSISDASARVVFDLGGSLADFTVTNVLIEELELQDPTDPEIPVGIESQKNVLVYPNPTKGKIYVENNSEYKEVTLYNAQGHVLFKNELEPGLNSLDLNMLSRGFYFLMLTNHHQKTVYKVINK